jgi:error-prone DNA polymerase
MATSIEYAELFCKTNYSFLEGASRPAELMERASELGLHSLAITDTNGVYGMPKAYRATREDWSGDAASGRRARLITGAELRLRDAEPITLLARDRAGYGLLCRLLTAAHADKPKGEASLDRAELRARLAESAARAGLIAAPRLTLEPARAQAQDAWLAELRELFGPERLLLPVSRFHDGLDARRLALVTRLERRFGARVVATNDVHYHLPARRPLHDVVTAIRHGVTLTTAGHRVFSNAERHLKSPAEMARLFHDLPRAIRNTVEVAESCVFSPAELRYRYPSEWIPAGETAQGYLARLVAEGARTRYKGEIPADVSRQIRHELELIEKLGFADYFLTIWEIVDFARGRGILCQGRGSAANSVVCYCLGITAVDPMRMNLLFERFISAERGEPPDIDIDFENARREEVIQHVYGKYGRHRAAMVAAVITYRSKMAAREVTKVLQGAKLPDEEAAKLADELYGFPRHLSIHSGGFTLSADPIIETVPVEPARMEGRTIVQWDKDDLDYIGLIKVDLLALGMLTALQKTLTMLGKRLHELPAEDAATYQMICRADTVGVFQIESRAQMSMLPRLKPRTFYDLVIQVAIVRPGPIVGNMVHPYLRRRRGEEAADYPHPKLEPILKRTLGVPLFQEQVMKMAIELAGFTPGEADQLRRAIAAWRSSGSIERMGKKLMEGLRRAGLPEEFIDRVFKQIQGFAEYGFPESHAASFALIAYASSYLKCHHPAEFTCALINSQPMGFYLNHTLVDDVKRHGVTVLPVHPNRSDWDCEVVAPRTIQLGWRVVGGMVEEHARALVAARRARPFAGLADFLSRAPVRRNVLHQLALGDAFRCFGLAQREALWEALAHDFVRATPAQATEGAQLNLFTGVEQAAAPARFAPLGNYEAVQADYSAYGLSTRGHPMQFLREMNRKIPRLTTIEARQGPGLRAATVAGLVIVRQRPPTAKETTFATLEDERGFLDLILHKDVYEKYGEIFLAHSFLVARGPIQREGDAVAMIVKSLAPLPWPGDPMEVKRGKEFS